ncbi:MAG: tRNA epoxyqueuosine(34) reductase QueG [Bacteroides sp.]
MIVSQLIKEKARELGFDACGIAPAHPLGEEEKSRLKEWLSQHHHAGMGYMEAHFEERCNPDKLVESARSIICLALNYYPQTTMREDQLQIAYYAYGKDYHDVMKKKLRELLVFVQELLPNCQGRIFCDTAPLLERYWAQQAGIGWIGKNTQLIIPHAGSYFFLGELVINTELAYDIPAPNRCGKCTRCLDACPTKALSHPHLLDSSACLSYLTIEHRSAIPARYLSLIGNHLYGCDDCQKCCPWNRFASANTTPELQPSETLMSMEEKDWCTLTLEQYRTLFKGSAVKRAKYEGLMKNLKKS